MGAFSAAYAQSSVTIYGTVDAGLTKRTGTTAAIGKRDNNKLGFKGVEDLGSGLKALFQLEIRYEPDTGTIENTAGTNSRPLFQGQSRVGLQGDFGTVRLGRGLTAFQESITAFEPWSGIPSVAGYQTDLQVAGYSSSPLDQPGNSGNRFSNALFYNTPVFGGVIQVNATVGTKEGNGNLAIVGHGTPTLPQFPANSVAAVTPFSLSGTANNGPFAAMLAYERNAAATKLWSIAASLKPMSDLKVMGSYQLQDQTDNVATNAFGTAINPKTKSWVLGANYTVGAGKWLIGYGQKTYDNSLNNPLLTKVKQASLGYEYSLSTRTYVYIEGSNKKDAKAAAAVNAGTSLNFYSVGIHHNF
jgi:predicted porin